MVLSEALRQILAHHCLFQEALHLGGSSLNYEVPSSEGLDFNHVSRLLPLSLRDSLAAPVHIMLDASLDSGAAEGLELFDSDFLTSILKFAPDLLDLAVLECMD